MIMENTKDALMIESTFDWIDIGTWKGLLLLKNSSHFKYQNNGDLDFQYIKEMMLSKNTLYEVKTKEKIVRPWGFYSVIMSCKNFLIKYLHINTLSATSMQIHKHRSEYYRILSGTAHVTLNDQVNIIHRNEAIKIPRFSMHRIENKDNKKAIEMIEMQVGDYISEDDIVRFADMYDRV